MTEIMVRQALALSPPSSRQDIVSALLADYGNSFGHDDASPTTYSPAPPLKDLPPPPPPPPRADSLKNKPLPAVQRMSMKFQLRVEEDAPLSPNGSRRESLEQRPRRRIISSRSLSREAKPASLKLLTSNGSTATVPPTPPLPVPPKILSSSEQFEDKDLPPPPPEKSVRRKSVKQAAMGNSASKAEKELSRNDSLLSQGEPKGAADVASDVAPVVKRKALPVPGLKKFTSLAELGKGPRGGKGGPMPLASAPRKESVDGQRPNSTGSDASQSTDRTIRPQQEQPPRNALATNQLPPTPNEDKSVAAPAPPRKAFTGMGLPSNPRAKAPPSPLHVRGKSSTGFNLLKMQKPGPQVVETITPEMTPSPKPRTNKAKKDTDISPASPLPPPNNQYRPFSFEALPPRQTQPTAQQSRPATATAPTSQSPAAPPPKTQPPPRRSSLDRPFANTNTRPAPQLSLGSPPFEPSPSIPENETSPPPFAPLTRQPIPLPVQSIPLISPSHLNCYTAHRTNIWSNNTFQPMGCMVCHENRRERKWACAWCQLRICRACSAELVQIPGRRLSVLLKVREEEEEEAEAQRRAEGVDRPGIVVEDVDEGVGVGGEYEDRFRMRG